MLYSLYLLYLLHSFYPLRLDLPDSDVDLMFESLAQLRNLPEELKVYPGHACVPPRLDPPPPTHPDLTHTPHPTPHAHPTHGFWRVCADGGASTTIGREKQAGLLRPISKEEFLRMFAR